MQSFLSQSLPWNSPALLSLVYNPDKKRARGFPLAHVKCLFCSLVIPSKATTTQFYCVSDTYILLVGDVEADKFRQSIFDYLGEDVDLIGKKAKSF